ncbi:chromosome alignment-maintaining phosphoprotein 1-like [Oncorhynchus clarkii lewisi]|uniref:chromosome alignment-maintaining phosphoprotein 1-like n=1 Tax=Oncorhynchus clarkii lewisi TaxID=490388 RepID=UPI0039B913DF
MSRVLYVHSPEPPPTGHSPEPPPTVHSPEPPAKVPSPGSPATIRSPEPPAMIHGPVPQKRRGQHKEAIEQLVRTNKITRQIHERSFFTKPVPGIVMGASSSSYVRQPSRGQRGYMKTGPRPWRRSQSQLSDTPGMIAPNVDLLNFGCSTKLTENSFH